MTHSLRTTGLELLLRYMAAIWSPREKQIQYCKQMQFTVIKMPSLQVVRYHLQHGFGVFLELGDLALSCEYCLGVGP